MVVEIQVSEDNTRPLCGFLLPHGGLCRKPRGINVWPLRPLRPWHALPDLLLITSSFGD